MIEKSPPYVILNYMLLERIIKGSKEARLKIITAVLTLLVFIVTTVSVIQDRKRKDVFFPAPGRPIRLVIPFEKGGKTDIMFRRLADNMKVNGINVEVLNIPGDGGVAGIEYVLAEKADGYTILASTAATITATLSGKTEGYKKLVMVAGLNEDPFMLVTRKNHFGNFKDFLKHSQEHEINIVTAGNGTLGHKIAENLLQKLATSSKCRILETNGGTSEMDAVISGVADLGVITQFEAISNPNIQPLVILTEGHSQTPLFRNVPTIREEGFPLDILGSAFCAVMVRNDVNPNTLVALESIVEAAYYSEDFQRFQDNYALIKLFLPLNQGSELFEEFIKNYSD